MSEIKNDRIFEQTNPDLSQGPSDEPNLEQKPPEPKVLTLQFSPETGASFKFQTEDEIKNTLVDFDSQSVKKPLLIQLEDTPKLTSKTHFDVLNDPVLDKYLYEYESRPFEERRLQDLILDKSIRQGHRRKALKDRKINLYFANLEKNVNHADYQAYLAQVTTQLESEGLWKENASECLESDSFPIDDLRDDDLNDKFEPRLLTEIFSPQMSTEKDPRLELIEKGIEWRDELSVDLSDLPQFTTPTIYNLCRRPPWGLYETIARKMTDGSFFAKHPQIDELFMCAYFVSKSIFSRKLFIQIKYEAFAGTPLQKRFRTYPYRRYLIDQKILEKLTRESLKKYFESNATVRKNIKDFVEKNALDSSQYKIILQSIWLRFFEVEKSLTEKQIEALDAIYTDYPRLSYTEAAKKAEISRDSFQDRISGAVKKIKDAFPELEGLKSPSTYLKSKEINLLYNGLFDKDEARKIHSLYQVNPITNEKIEIRARSSPPSISEDAPGKFVVRAWSIFSTPVPDILDTEFFMGLMPEGLARRMKGKKNIRD